jgi:hypothetical protein
LAGWGLFNTSVVRLAIATSRLNPVLAFSEDDKRIANDKLTVEQRKAIANAKNINNSDVDRV